MSWLCWIPFAASMFSACGSPPPLAVGYVEGEYVLLAPIENAEIRTVSVRRGDQVEAGQELAALEDADVAIAVAQAEAALAQAKAQLADLKLGKRPEEIAVLEAAIRSAEAQASEAQRVMARTQELRQRGIATQADLDRAATSVETAEAAVGKAKADLEVAKLPARAETITAAEHQAEQAAATLEQARWRLSKRRITAPVAGRVNDVIRTAGDISGPAAPVISLLPDGAVKIKLYVPEQAFSAVRVGDLLAVRCDGCPEGLTARVSYASPDPEFTPPVIYSLETRQKLSHLIEARPEDEAAALKPGQIVDVRLLADER
ncbi:MAG: HlyD family efflux transporter periplasmic adaptor subunit [Rhizobiaceae bacterium]|nr:HlyD family efflux transporter periplasmic adaptor subunit [Rhizobiaceae bacterium]MCV0406063.1 HlyD family efflux transporter periplasmic adaptor subunit [Rhizobiaceae bacterium]